MEKPNLPEENTLPELTGLGELEMEETRPELNRRRQRQADLDDDWNDVTFALVLAGLLMLLIFVSILVLVNLASASAIKVFLINPFQKNQVSFYG